MNTRLSPTLLLLLAGTVVLCALPKPVLGNLFVTDPNSGTIGEYTDSGVPINASLITGLYFPSSIAVSDGFLYVTGALPGTVGKYTTSGETINASLITGLNAVDIEVSGGDLYATEKNSLTGIGRVGKYTTSGATINASLISGLFFPEGLAISGSNLFVVEGAGIGEYTTSGLTVDASLITITSDFASYDLEVSGSNLFIAYNYGDDALVGKYGIDGTVINPRLILAGGIYGGLAISGTDLFVSGGDVGKYTTSGEAVAVPLIITSFGSGGIAVEDSATVPETLSTLWFGLTVVGLLGIARLKPHAAHTTNF